MTIFAYIVGDTPIRVWGLTSRERLHRQFLQLKNVTPVEDLNSLPREASILMLRADYVTEVRTLKLLLDRPGAVLRCPVDGQLAAAFAPRSQVEHTIALLNQNEADAPAHLDIVEPGSLGDYDPMLRRAAPPLLEPLSEDNRQLLEDKLYGSSYKGITDLVTKWLWPRPAKKGVRLCTAAGITPNMVTITGVALMLAVCGLFYQGYFVAGLAAGWFMTYLDTVDGKLARVTEQSSKLGHVLDHGMDIIHPPFWYVLWGMALIHTPVLFGLDRVDMYWLIAFGYIFGRIAEQSFHLLGDTSMFAWRPFDAWFRLITARRNPCLLILTVAYLAGRPDWGFIGVTLWTVATTAVLIMRLLQGALVRVRSGPLCSWLADRETAARQYPRTYRIFGATRGAYAPG